MEAWISKPGSPNRSEIGDGGLELQASISDLRTDWRSRLGSPSLDLGSKIGDGGLDLQASISDPIGDRGLESSTSEPRFDGDRVFAGFVAGRSGAPTFATHYCSNSSLFTANSTCQANLNLLLSDISAKSTRLDGFYKTSVGQKLPDVAICLLFCRGDLTPAACKDCIFTATKDIRTRCPLDKNIIIWYDVCTLRYTNKSELNNLYPFENFNTTTQNVIQPEQFNGLLASTMKSLAQEAANSQSD
ncbi:hypothetical protein SO802_007575 [Lithocarpus litseifolius]|uniref:Gnk2-homologous domain-containing protein n=1 Tax=Lithocarpus litseifolius TaxID=425828 RepID=A0AAW2DRL1_9ROSI